MKYLKFLSLPLMVLALASCSKKNEMATPDNNSELTAKLRGNWRYAEVYLKADTRSTAGNTLTTSNYSYNAIIKSGTINIDNSNFKIDKLSYSINSVIHMSMYLGGQHYDDMDLPFNFEAPEYSASVPYRIVGNDSIYFERGFIPNPSNNQTGVNTEPSGGKISWSKDTLVISTVTVVDKTLTVDGVVTRDQANAVAIQKLVKQ